MDLVITGQIVVRDVIQENDDQGVLVFGKQPVDAQFAFKSTPGIEKYFGIYKTMPYGFLVVFYRVVWFGHNFINIVLTPSIVMSFS